VDITAPVEGPYAVFVGRLNPAKPISGKLTITEAGAALPTKLAPPAKK